MDKKELRQIMRARRSQVSQTEFECCSKAVFDQFKIVLDQFSVDTILLYHSTQNEIDTTRIFYEAKSRGLRVGYPKVFGDTMRFFLVNNLKELKKGYMNILEPDPEDAVEIDPTYGICVVPGTAFDEKCNRIGFGKAFYDRYLAKHLQLIKIGIAYDFQVVECLISEPHDIVLDYIITESRVINNE